MIELPMQPLVFGVELVRIIRRGILRGTLRVLTIFPFIMLRAFNKMNR
jgi:hypothetical protein